MILIRGQYRKHCLKVLYKCGVHHGDVLALYAFSGFLMWVSGEPLGRCIAIQFLPVSQQILTASDGLSRSWLVFTN